MTTETGKNLRRGGFLLALLVLLGTSVRTVNADPLVFSNVTAYQNSTKVDLLSHPGTMIFGPQITFSVDIAGTLGSGQSDTLHIVYTELGSLPIVQDFSIPLFGTVQPPFTLFFTITSPGANIQGIPASLTLDLLNSSPDFDGITPGQRSNSYTYGFDVARPVPEPVTVFAFAGGLVITALRRRRSD
jgi:hypothetical protein